MHFSNLSKLINEALDSHFKSENEVSAIDTDEALTELADAQCALGKVIFLAEEDKVEHQVMRELGLLNTVLADISRKVLVETSNRRFEAEQKQLQAVK